MLSATSVEAASIAHYMLAACILASIYVDKDKTQQDLSPNTAPLCAQNTEAAAKMVETRTFAVDVNAACASATLAFCASHDLMFKAYTLDLISTLLNFTCLFPLLFLWSLLQMRRELKHSCLLNCSESDLQLLPRNY